MPESSRRRPPLTRHDTIGENERVRRVYQALSEEARSKVLAMHDHKGHLTIWWKDLGGPIRKRFWREAEVAWQSQCEVLGCHRSAEGIIMRQFPGGAVFSDDDVDLPPLVSTL